MLVKFLIIVTTLFLFSVPVFAGTFLDTFNLMAKRWMDDNKFGWIRDPLSRGRAFQMAVISL